MDKRTSFKGLCTGCGICCRMAHLVPNFPEPLTDEGVCSHLQEDNTCGIYDRRPVICNVDEAYELYKDYFKSKEHYIDETVKMCNQYIKAVALDDKYLIPE